MAAFEAMQRHARTVDRNIDVRYTRMALQRLEQRPRRMGVRRSTQPKVLCLRLG